MPSDGDLSHGRLLGISFIITVFSGSITSGRSFAFIADFAEEGRAGLEFMGDDKAV